MNEKIKLTEYSKGSGCGCKIAPAVLQQVLKGNQSFSDSKLLIGYESGDDAAVYDAGNDQLIISTTDFFTPIVNNAYDFGRIAAANAISDVYAMGGKPLMALAVLGWPVEKIPVQIANEVMEGARTICTQAEIVLAGGHSIEITEPVFGLCVTGLVSRQHLKRNNTAKPGDFLFVTKPLGSGILASALKRGLLKENLQSELIRRLTQINSAGAVLGRIEGVTAMTDVTGFGLLGHLTEMTGQQNLTAEIRKVDIPKLSGVEEYMGQMIYPENTTRNYTAFSSRTSGMRDLEFLLYCDPQTNGGLMFSVSPQAVDRVKKLLHEQEQEFWMIGQMKEFQNHSVEFIE